MYEPYLATFRNGLHSIDISPNADTTDGAGFTVTVTYAVTTDSLAWITIDGNGTVHPAFGGTGTSPDQLDAYAEQAVSIWRTITANTETTCRYAVPADHELSQDDATLVIDA